MENITQLCKKYPDLPWEWEFAVCNNSLLPEDIDYYPLYYRRYLRRKFASEDDYHALLGCYMGKTGGSHRPGKYCQYDGFLITRSKMEDMLESKMPGIEKCIHLTWDIVLDNPDYPWNYEKMTENPMIPDEVIKANPELPWSRSSIMKFRKMANELVIEQDSMFYGNLNADINKLANLGDPRKTCNPLITPEFVKQHPEIEWDYKWLSRNPSLTIEFVLENRQHFDGVWGAISATLGSEIRDFAHAQRVSCTDFKPKHFRDNPLYRIAMRMPFD